MARKSRNALQAGAEIQHPAFRACHYGRLSVEDGDDEQNNSLGNQLKICMHFIDAHAELELVARHCDNGYTGMNYERPGFRQMMEDIGRGLVNCVIVKDISRLGRHFVQTSELVERTFPARGVRLICVNDGYDSADEGADAAALTLPLKMVMNEYYVHDISQKIRSGIAARMKSGEFLPAAGSVPYGYIRNAAAGTYDVDEETAPVVRRIYELRAQGLSFSGIARRLNAGGVPSPGRLRYLRGSTKAAKYEDPLWLRGTVRKILENRAYTGSRVHGAGRDGGEFVIEGSHPAIVSAGLFERVQELNCRRAAEREAYSERSAVAADRRGLFRGRLFCADCGAAMGAAKSCARPGSAAPSRVYFDCNTYRYSAHARCSCHSIRQEDLLRVVTDTIGRQMALAADVEELAARLRRSPGVLRRQREAGERRNAAVRERRAMEARLQRLLEDMSEGLLSREEYLYIKAEYNARYASLAEAEAAAGQEALELSAALAAAERWLRSAAEWRERSEPDGRLLDELVARIEVTSGRGVRVIFNCADPVGPLLRQLEEGGAADAV